MNKSHFTFCISLALLQACSPDSTQTRNLTEQEISQLQTIANSPTDQTQDQDDTETSPDDREDHDETENEDDSIPDPSPSPGSKPKPKPKPKPLPTIPPKRTPGNVSVFDNCKAYPYSAEALYQERVGFGAKTKGGDPNVVYTVYNLNDSGPGSLREGLETKRSQWIIFNVQGTIKLKTRINAKSHKTVDGRGRKIIVDGNIAFGTDQENIILSDFSMTYPRGFKNSDGDVLAIRGKGGKKSEDFSNRGYWFHHLELYKGGDGLFDVRGATEITLSWSHLHSHSKAMLMWKDQDQKPTPGMRVTLHHNYFEKLSRRGPQFHYGQAHFYNNLVYQFYEFGAASLSDAEFYSENNVYEARPGTVCLSDCEDPNSPTGDSDIQISKKALVTEWDSSSAGSINSTGDRSINGAELDSRKENDVFKPKDHYKYHAEKASDALSKNLKNKSGPRRSYCH